MIEFNGLKSDVIGFCKQIRRMKGLTSGAKLLFEEVLSLPENWQISWAWFAKELGVGKKSIYNWVDELIKMELWKVDKDNNIEFLESVKITQSVNFTQDSESVNFTQNSVKITQSVNFTHNKKELQGLNFLKKEQKKESACVREFENDENLGENQSENSAQNENGENNFALSARNCVNFTENQGEINEQERQERGEFNAWGGENLTNDNIFEPKNSAAGEKSWAASGQRNTDNGTRTDGETARGGEFKAQGTASGTARTFGGEVVLNSAGQMPQMQKGKLNTAAAIADYLTQRANGTRNTERGTRADGEREANADLPAPQTPPRTGGGLNAAQKTPKKQPKTAQTPEQTAEAMLEKHGEIVKSANFSEIEREAVLEWLAYKAEHPKYPLTERNSKSILRQCVKIKGENKDLPETIERTIANGWADLRWVADKPAQNAYKSAWQQQQEQKQASWKAIIEKYRPKNEQKQAQKAV